MPSCRNYGYEEGDRQSARTQQGQEAASGIIQAEQGRAGRGQNLSRLGVECPPKYPEGKGGEIARGVSRDRGKGKKSERRRGRRGVIGDEDFGFRSTEPLQDAC